MFPHTKNATNDTAAATAIKF